jgi:peptidoglycan/xylan/chitin deacetylase (PgdA/CDA1 family)
MRVSGIHRSTAKVTEQQTGVMGKDWIKRGLIASGFTRLAGRLKGQGVAILMYHSVMDEPRSQDQTLGGIIHSSGVFERQMEIVAAEYQPVRLDEVLLFLRGEKALPARAVVITFDDGYSDNCEIAVPILSRVGVPATFYVTVDCIDRAKLPWPSRLRWAFFTTKKKSWEGQNGTIWPLEDAEQRDRTFLAACDDCAKLAGEAQERFVDGIEGELQTEVSEQRLMMTWDQVRELVRKGHSVGSHSVTHPNMAYLCEEDAMTELAESKRKLEHALSTPIVHFSYPCPALSPHWSERTVKISREVGYHTAVTTDGGLVRRYDRPLSLHRVRPTKAVEGLRWNLECTFLGRAV